MNHHAEATKHYRDATIVGTIMLWQMSKWLEEANDEYGIQSRIKSSTVKIQTKGYENHPSIKLYLITDIATAYLIRITKVSIVSYRKHDTHAVTGSIDPNWGIMGAEEFSREGIYKTIEEIFRSERELLDHYF